MIYDSEAYIWPSKFMMLNFIFAQTLCCASQRQAAPTPTLVSDVGGNQNVIQVLPVKFKLYKYVMHT